jgi:hypothetical protein
MNWNPFTRITALEHQVQELQRALADVMKPWNVSVSKPKVTDEEKIARRREQHRAYYARQKAKEKQREYNRTYRERKKAEKMSAGGTA